MVVLTSSNGSVECEEGPACSVLHLETHRLSATELVLLCQKQLNVVIDTEFADSLLLKFASDTAEIMSKLDAYRDDLEQLRYIVALEGCSSVLTL